MFVDVGNGSELKENANSMCPDLELVIALYCVVVICCSTLTSLDTDSEVVV